MIVANIQALKPYHKAISRGFLHVVAMNPSLPVSFRSSRVAWQALILHAPYDGPMDLRRRMRAFLEEAMTPMIVLFQYLFQGRGHSAASQEIRVIVKRAVSGCS